MLVLVQVVSETVILVATVLMVVVPEMIIVVGTEMVLFTVAMVNGSSRD